MDIQIGKQHIAFVAFLAATLYLMHKTRQLEQALRLVYEYVDYFDRRIGGGSAMTRAQPQRTFAPPREAPVVHMQRENRRGGTEQSSGDPKWGPDFDELDGAMVGGKVKK